jgi:hypothetical protein
MSVLYLIRECIEVCFVGGSHIVAAHARIL